MVRSISELKNLSGARVLVRLDLNVPIQNGGVEDPYRIERALPTVKYLLDHGARVVLMSHMSDKMGTLQPVYAYLKTKIHVSFVDDISGTKAREEAGKLGNGTALLLQNIRRDAREEANDEGFARELASLADIYVNDAFPVSHRAHASVVGVSKLLPSYAGFQLVAEVEGLSPALSPESPSLAIVGGAKLVTKVKLIDTLLSKYDYVFVGGAIVNDFYRAKGYEVGKSLVSGADHAKPMLTNSKIILPNELIVLNPAGSHETVATEVGTEDVIIDISPTAIQKLAPIVAKSKSILWNGPMGNFEKGFRSGTDDLAKLIAGSSAKSVVGGGDTLSSIQSLNLMDKFSFVSTAGGAMLDFLANGTLPGIEALKNSK
ncbi:phosphoglycerate kinase [Patescibacteria group bacterium]|nr:phosphoglycerate kinase [Patescibacteria group bacterium]